MASTVTPLPLATVASNQIQRVLTGIVLVPTVLALVLYAPPPLFAAAVVLIALLALREFLDLADKYGLAPLHGLAYVFAFGAVLWPLTPWEIMPYHGLLVILALALAMRSSRPLEKSLGGAGSTLLGVLYVALPMAYLVSLRQRPTGEYLALYVLILTWISDTAAYYAGRTFGRHKLAPRVSPGKTWEGTVGSLLAALVFGYFWMQYFVPRAPLWLNLATAAAVNIAGQFGDLAESALKRGADVKDSGSLLPGHGGALDRIDALLFAIPVMWYDVLILLQPYLSPGT